MPTNKGGFTTKVLEYAVFIIVFMVTLAGCDTDEYHNVFMKVREGEETGKIVQAYHVVFEGTKLSITIQDIKNALEYAQETL